MNTKILIPCPLFGAFRDSQIIIQTADNAAKITFRPVLTFRKKYAIIAKTPFERRKTGMIILRILLWILLAILLLLFLVCLVNVRITLGNRNGKFGWKLTVGGIRIDPMRFAKKKDNHKKKDEKHTWKTAEKKEKKSSQKDGDRVDKADKKSVGTVLNIVAKVAKTASEVLPKGFRIGLKRLNIAVGGTDAAQIALDYGRYYAILNGIFALFDGYKGLFYGFRYKRNKINIQADFMSPKTKAEYELTISFFIWQLLFSGIRIGISAIGAIIENAEEDDNAVNDKAAEEKRISEAERTINKAKDSKTVHGNTTTKINKDNGGK